MSFDHHRRSLAGGPIERDGSRPRQVTPAAPFVAYRIAEMPKISRPTIRVWISGVPSGMVAPAVSR